MSKTSRQLVRGETKEGLPEKEAAGLAKIRDCKLLNTIHHPNGRIEECYSDGSRNFRGQGDGILCILGAGSASVMWQERNHSMIIPLLLEAARQMPSRSIEVEDILIYKEEARVMLEALRTGNAQFFRNIGDALMPRISAVKASAEKAKRREILNDEVLGSIIAAAAEIGGVPTLNSCLIRYRERNRVYAGETTGQFKKKVVRRGFLWLCD